MNNLMEQFDTGRLSALEGGECPYYATSDCADAWHAGKAYETRRPSPYSPSKVWHGTGFRINVQDGIGHPTPASAPRFVYLVTYNRSGGASVIRDSRRESRS